INEMALFVNNSIEHIDDSEPVLLQAIDIQINQKILPKVSGSFGKLDEPLRKLIHYMMPSTISSSTDFASINVDTVHQIDDFASSDYPESYKKCCSLYLNAAHNGFTSYLE